MCWRFTRTVFTVFIAAICRAGGVQANTTIGRQTVNRGIRLSSKHGQSSQSAVTSGTISRESQLTRLGLLPLSSSICRYLEFRLLDTNLVLRDLSRTESELKYWPETTRFIDNFIWKTFFGEKILLNKMFSSSL